MTERGYGQPSRVLEGTPPILSLGTITRAGQSRRDHASRADGFTPLTARMWSDVDRIDLDTGVHGRPPSCVFGDHRREGIRQRLCV